MIDFGNIEYLKNGNLRQQEAYKVLTEHRVMEILKDYSPVLVGTIPIEIDIENSDLDICCFWNDKEEFEENIKQEFSKYPKFVSWQSLKRGFETVVANFVINDFEIEIFGQNRPAKQQEAYRHMLIEHKILQEKGMEFKDQVIALKQKGIKTEPAFAKLLGIEGDPYLGLLEFDKK